LDFGAAIFLSPFKTSKTNEFQSKAYCSPERLESTKVNAQSDLWSLGVVLYELVVGRVPFDGNTAAEVERSILQRRPPQFPQNPQYSAGLRSIIRKALSPNIGDRYPSAAAFKSDLIRFREGQRTRAEKEEDSQVTIQTQKPEGERPPTVDLDRTERTTRAILEHAEPAQNRSAPDLQAASDEETNLGKSIGSTAPKRRGRYLRLVARVAALIVVLIVANDLRVWLQARGLSTDLLAGQISTEQAWNEYQSLSAQSIMGFLTVQPALKQRFINDAIRVIDNYHMDNPDVRENDWKASVTGLKRALEMYPSEKEVKGRLFYCEGHVERINGEAADRRNQRDTARKRFNEAINKFNLASGELPQWPDPYLGLARVYAYGLDDIENGTKMIERLDQLGYSLGKREKATLADGLRVRGQRLWKESRTIGDFEHADEILAKAEEYLNRAINIYKDIIPFGNAARNLQQAQESIDRIWKWREENGGL
jgi:hypothetical protein